MNPFVRGTLARFMTVATTDTNRYQNSRFAHDRAKRLMPGGVSSPVRAYHAVGGQPIVVREGKGAWVTDVDGNRYIDYVGSYGPLILGHAPQRVLAEVEQAAGRGVSFGMPTEAESQLAQKIIDAIDSIDLVRFVNSGTEATMSAIRLARAATARTKIVKFTGCYHGHSDGLLVQAGSGATTLGVPSSPGAPSAITELTVLAPYNDLATVSEVFRKHSQTIAAVIVEPVAGNMGTIPPQQGFLQGLQELCDEHDAILIFDEVMTGFRVAYGGAQSLYGVKPDLTCLGKVIGGGLPCAAYGGREDLMRRVAPDGPVYQAGTLSGNPLTMAAGLATIEELSEPGVYDRLDHATTQLARGLERAAAEAGAAISQGDSGDASGGRVAVVCQQVGSMLCCFFTDTEVNNYEQAVRCDTDAYAVFFGSMLDHGVVLPPSQFETWFVSTAHDERCIQKTIEAAGAAFETVVARQISPDVTTSARS